MIFVDKIFGGYVGIGILKMFFENIKKIFLYVFLKKIYNLDMFFYLVFLILYGD